MRPNDWPCATLRQRRGAPDPCRNLNDCMLKARAVAIAEAWERINGLGMLSSGAV